jgi:chitin synthase
MSRPPPIQFPPEYAAQRGQQRPGDVPIPTTTARAAPRRLVSNAGRNGPTGNPSLRRAKTLVRPERGVAVAPLINPPAPTVGPSGSGVLPSNNASKSPADSWDTWRIFSHVVTFWAPGFLLSAVGRMKDKPTRQAWREKIALCVVAATLGVSVGFATVFLSKVLCPNSAGFSGSQFRRVNTSDTQGLISVNGYLFNISNSDTTLINYFQAAKSFGGIDLTPNFTRTAAQFTSCSHLSFKAATDNPCPTSTSCVLPAISNATLTQQRLVNTTDPVGYDWSQVGVLKYYLVIDGYVLNFTPYFAQNTAPTPTDPVDTALRTVLFQQNTLSGKDATRLFSGSQVLSAAYPCLLERYLAGNIDKTPPGCFIASLFLYTSLIIIMGVVLARFAMACVFSWFISRSLVKPPKNLSRKVISPAVMPEGANTTVDNQNGTAPWAKQGGPNNKKLGKNQLPAPGLRGMKSIKGPSGNNGQVAAPVISMATIGRELFCVCLVTCYSEGRDSIKGTLDSIALTNYSDSRKLLFVVCDGMITGAGETQSTPDICVGLLDADPRFGNPAPMGYVAVGLGPKKENRAMVYAGHYGACPAGRSALVDWSLLIDKMTQWSRIDGPQPLLSSNVGRKPKLLTRKNRAIVESAIVSWS